MFQNTHQTSLITHKNAMLCRYPLRFCLLLSANHAVISPHLIALFNSVEDTWKADQFISISKVHVVIAQILSPVVIVFRDLAIHNSHLLDMLAYLPNLFAISTHLIVSPMVSARFVPAIAPLAIRFPTPADTAQIATWMISSFEISSAVL